MTLIFRKPLPNVEHPEMPADVVCRRRAAGMACALRLSQLIDAHNARHPAAQLSKENIYVLEKAREAGSIASQERCLIRVHERCCQDSE